MFQYSHAVFAVVPNLLRYPAGRMFVFPLMGGLCFRGQVAHGRILINPDNPPARVAFDHGRARARKIGPIENPRRHLGVYLIGENLNVHGISHVHQTQGICGGKPTLSPLLSSRDVLREQNSIAPEPTIMLLDLSEAIEPITA
jgi:hypothetical protein